MRCDLCRDFFRPSIRQLEKRLVFVFPVKRNKYPKMNKSGYQLTQRKAERTHPLKISISQKYLNCGC